MITYLRGVKPSGLDRRRLDPDQSVLAPPEPTGQTAPMRVSYFVDVISSWCWYAEPAWLELSQRLAGSAELLWVPAPIPPEALPSDAAECDWYYRRSGTLNRAPRMMNSGWLEHGPGADPALPLRLAEAARQLGASGDTVRLALAEAGLVRGEAILRASVALPIAAQASGLEETRLAGAAAAPAVEQALAAGAAAFARLALTQRPAFVLENSIGDRVAISGLVRPALLLSAAAELQADEEAYASYAVHHGVSPG